MFVVFDLDGTLALNEYRVHHIRKEPKDYDAFFAACGGDTPCGVVIQMLYRHLLVGDDVEIWSGRSDQVRAETEAWLRTHVFTDLRFCAPASIRCLSRMRRAGDRQPDVRLKRGWLHEARAAGRAPDLVYDDRDCVVAMWREEGVPCFQVARGPF